MTAEFRDGDHVNVVIPNATYREPRLGTGGRSAISVNSMAGIITLPSNAVIQPTNAVTAPPSTATDVEPRLCVGQQVEVRFNAVVHRVDDPKHVSIAHPVYDGGHITVSRRNVTIVDDPAGDPIGTVRRHDATGGVVVGVRRHVDDGTVGHWRVVERGSHVSVSFSLPPDEVTTANGWRVVGNIGALLAGE